MATSKRTKYNVDDYYDYDEEDYGGEYGEEDE